MTIEDKIAALLAKAESTNHPAEAEAFMAKAEELMLKYGVQRAIRTRREEIITTRITVKNGHGYAPAMTAVAHAVAPSFSVRSLRSTKYDGSHVVWLIGYRGDVEQVETLANSLMAQSRAQAMYWWRTEGKILHPYYDANEAFYARREFIYAFASGVRARLEETRNRVIDDAEPGTALVLVDRKKRVNDWVSQNMKVGAGRTTSRRAGSIAAAVAGKQAGRESIGSKAIR